MNFLRLLPVIISFLLLAAHFLRSGQLFMVLVPLALCLLPAFRAAWIPRLIQLALLLGAIEWLRTMLSVAHVRLEYGLPWARMAVILAAVAVFTACSGLVFRNRALRSRYGGFKNPES